ncbi:MAG TPA: hypothetical protein VM143_08035 [Acidimicrobiales bacterium]|nr:hypothetical protein [Acidimicrobiales bacterium]
MTPTPTPRRPSLETLFVATFALLGLRIGLRPLGDNSLFIHLRTGIDLVRTGHIPRSDPYSFTAAGDAWVVQSWLASAAYGVAERLGGFEAVRLLHGLLYALLAGVLGRSVRTGSAWRTALAGVLAIGLGIVYWSPRPLAFGLLGLAATVWVVERRRKWWWLLPIVWVWANAHGSFVLGLGWLVLVVAGERLDGHRRPDSLPWLGGFVAGLAAACLNPLGPRLLIFPLVVVSRREAFSHVVEWRSPSFQSGTGILTLLCLVGALVVVARSRPPWRDLLPVAGFVVAGLAAQRNLPMVAVVVAPVLRRSLRAPRGDVVEVAPRINVTIAAVLGVLALLFVVVAAVGEPFDLEGYPVRAASALDARGPVRVATTDVAAGYLILRGGPFVLIDDRVDLYPVKTTEDYLRLRDGRPDALDVLDRYDPDVVLWETDRALSAQLAASERWRRVEVLDGWGVWVRASATP